MWGGKDVDGETSAENSTTTSAAEREAEEMSELEAIETLRLHEMNQERRSSSGSLKGERISSWWTSWSCHTSRRRRSCAGAAAISGRKASMASADRPCSMAVRPPQCSSLAITCRVCPRSRSGVAARRGRSERAAGRATGCDTRMSRHTRPTARQGACFASKTSPSSRGGEPNLGSSLRHHDDVAGLQPHSSDRSEMDRGEAE